MILMPETVIERALDEWGVGCLDSRAARDAVMAALRAAGCRRGPRAFNPPGPIPRFRNLSRDTFNRPALRAAGTQPQERVYHLNH